MKREIIKHGDVGQIKTLRATDRNFSFHCKWGTDPGGGDRHQNL